MASGNRSIGIGSMLGTSFEGAFLATTPDLGFVLLTATEEEGPAYVKNRIKFTYIDKSGDYYNLLGLKNMFI